MKKTLLILFPILLMLSGCTSDSKYNEMMDQLSEANDQIKSLKHELEEVNKSHSTAIVQVKELEEELNDLKNGPQMSIVEIRKQFESKSYDKVLELSASLHTKFNGVPEDIEAQKLVKEIQDIKDKEAKKAEEEKARLLAEQTKSSQEKARSIMRVSKVYPGKPNSADGVDLYIIWKNNSSNTIKYAYFEVQPYNAVGDIVTSEIGGHSTFRGKETGPFNKGEGSNGNTYWENAWYNNTIKKVKLVSVNIEYMDGTSISLKDDDINFIQY